MVWPGGPDDADNVLAQPTRARLFARLAALGRPAVTGELAEELGLHRSGVRAHLERLERAGLVTRARMPQPRGRPRDGWSIAPEARPHGAPPESYRRLAAWLARSVPPRPGRLREVRAAGRDVGRELPAASERPGADERPGDGGADAIGRTLTALGFAPQREPARGGVIFRLGCCPYRDAVRTNQPVVCALHEGLTQGVLDTVAPSARLRGFVPRDPDRGGCVIEVEGLGRSA